MTQHDNGNSPGLFVDGTPFQSDKPTITGSDIRILASVPETVDLFLKVPGHPDQLVEATTIGSCQQSCRVNSSS